MKKKIYELEIDQFGVITFAGSNAIARAIPIGRPFKIFITNVHTSKIPYQFKKTLRNDEAMKNANAYIADQKDLSSNAGFYEHGRITYVVAVQAYKI